MCIEIIFITALKRSILIRFVVLFNINYGYDNGYYKKHAHLS